MLEGDVVVVLANGPEIRAYNEDKDDEFEVISTEKRVEALDYDPTRQIVFWADSYDKTIRRSYMVGAMDGAARSGYAQDLDLKLSAKPTALAVDYVGDNLYWTEAERAGAKPRGRVLVARTDGRYRRALVAAGLEAPTSLALDPHKGRMYWADAGSAPKIEGSWMDGSVRRPLVTDAVRHPTGLTVDLAGDRRVFWADTKLDTIEVMRFDGSGRRVVARGEALKHPVALDVFQSRLYWVARDSGELLRQDKFGRGVPTVVRRALERPAAVKVYHPLRYNSTRGDACPPGACSHLCLPVPGGHRCACPEQGSGQQSPVTPKRPPAERAVCDAPAESPRFEPRACPCHNGGVCSPDETGELSCSCRPPLQPPLCATASASTSRAPPAAIAVPLALLALLALGAAAAWFVVRKRPL